MFQSTNHKLYRSSLFWHYPHHHPGGATPYSAIRNGNYKLIEFFEDGTLELYNLADDIGEENDLAETNPDIVNKLYEELQSWREETGAQYPSLNPIYKKELEIEL